MSSIILFYFQFFYCLCILIPPERKSAIVCLRVRDVINYSVNSYACSLLIEWLEGHFELRSIFLCEGNIFIVDMRVKVA